MASVPALETAPGPHFAGAGVGKRGWDGFEAGTGSLRANSSPFAMAEREFAYTRNNRLAMGEGDFSVEGRTGRGSLRKRNHATD